MTNSKNTVTVTKENIKKLEEKLGEVLGLERAAQNAVEELTTTRKLLKSDKKDMSKEIQDEAKSHEDQLQEVISKLSEDEDIKLDKDSVEDTSKETEKKLAKMMKTYLGEEPDTSEAIEFLCLAEGGEVIHYEVLSEICKNFDEKKLSTTVKSILKEEQDHLKRCLEMAKEAVSSS